MLCVMCFSQSSCRVGEVPQHPPEGVRVFFFTKYKGDSPEGQRLHEMLKALEAAMDAAGVTDRLAFEVMPKAEPMAKPDFMPHAWPNAAYTANMVGESNIDVYKMDDVAAHMPSDWDSPWTPREDVTAEAIVTFEVDIAMDATPEDWARGVVEELRAKLENGLSCDA